MKKMIYFLFAFCLSLPVRGQVVAIQNDKGRIFYLGCFNSIKVAVEAKQSKSISIKINNGKIKNSGNGNYIIIPDRLGICLIEVMQKTSKGVNKIGEERYIINAAPDPVPHFANKAGGIIPASIARIQIAPSAAMPTSECGCTRIIIDSFTMIVIRKDKVIFFRSINNPNGARFSDDDTVSTFLKTVQTGDRMIFTGITCKMADNRTRYLQPMEFILADKE